MNFNKTFAAALTIALTAGLNVSSIASAAPMKVKKEARVQTTQVEVNKKSQTNTIKKSDNNSNKPLASAQGGKCSRVPFC